MPTYTLRHLEYLIACADHGSIAQAAIALNVSQPTVSVAIAKLEDQFGLQLLMRHHGQGVTTTVGAQKVLHASRHLLAQARDLSNLAKESSQSVNGDLRIGAFSAMAPTILPELVSELKASFPGIRLQFQEGTQLELITRLRNGELELGLLYDIDVPNDIICTELALRSPYVALPRGHRLVEQDCISLNDLVDEPFILLDVPPSREYFLGLFRSVSLTPQVAISSPSLELVRGLVGQGLGYSILVTRPAGDVTHDGKKLEIRALCDQVATSRIVLARHESLRSTRITDSFESVAKRVIS